MVKTLRASERARAGGGGGRIEWFFCVEFWMMSRRCGRDVNTMYRLRITRVGRRRAGGGEGYQVRGDGWHPVEYGCCRTRASRRRQTTRMRWMCERAPVGLWEWAAGGVLCPMVAEALRHDHMTRKRHCAACATSRRSVMFSQHHLPSPLSELPSLRDLDVPSSAESSAVNLPDPPSLSAPWTHTPMSHLHPESTRSPYIGSVQSQVISYLVTLIFLSLCLALYTTSNATVVSPTDTRQRDCRRPPSIQQLRLQIAP